MRGPQRGSGFALVGVQARDLLLLLHVAPPFRAACLASVGAPPSVFEGGSVSVAQVVPPSDFLGGRPEAFRFHVRIRRVFGRICL